MAVIQFLPKHDCLHGNWSKEFKNLLCPASLATGVIAKDQTATVMTWDKSDIDCTTYYQWTLASTQRDKQQQLWPESSSK